MPTEAQDRVLRSFQTLSSARRAGLAQQLKEAQAPARLNHYVYEMRAAPPNPDILRLEIDKHDTRLQQYLIALTGGPHEK